MPLPTLRGHQQTNLDELRAEVSLGHHPLLVAPCGYGKGTLITYIVHSAVSLGHAVVFAVRGKSLVADMSERVKRLGIPHGVLMGARLRERWHPVQVASIDTLYRMAVLPAASLIIVDEAHMALAPTFRKTLDRYPDATVIGCTATPVRLDGKGLGRATGGLFDSMVLGPSELELIKQGYLVRSRVLEPPPTQGAKDVKLGINDNLGQQESVFDKVKLIGDQVRHYKQHAAGRKGVTFATTQKHALHIAQQFTDAGIPWAYVDADTPMGDPLAPEPGTRAYIYRDLDRNDGTLLGVSSVGCTAIGWDHPIVSYLGIMRRTGSFGLWHQMMGRGSRIHPEKQDFLIIDHAGNSQLHAPLGYFESEIEWSLDGEAVKKSKKKPTLVVTCKQSVMNCWCGRTADHTDAGDHLACYGTFRRGPAQCPHCGCPIQKQDREIEIEDQEMVTRERPNVKGPPPKRSQMSMWDAQPDANGLISLGTPTSRRAAFESILRVARSKGYNPGWAAHVFKGRFKMEVPRDWMPRGG